MLETTGGYRRGLDGIDLHGLLGAEFRGSGEDVIGY